MKLNYYYTIIIIIIIIIIILFYQIQQVIDNFKNKLMNHSNHNNIIKNSGSNPCVDKLSDIEYLEHMIPHHQVAIDMSNLLISKTRNPTMLKICRDIIRSQSYEIWEMTHMKKNLSNNMVDDTKWIVDGTITNLDIDYPIMSKAKDGKCNPLFFKPNDHAKHMKNMKLTDKSYLEHMIPHHQVAIDMSHRLLLHTNNSYLLYFSRKLIADQKNEIYLMNNLLKNTYNYKSDLFNQE